MKKTFIFTFSSGAEEVVEYDDEIITEEGAREIYRNMDKFYFGSSCGRESMNDSRPEDFND